MLKKDGFEWNPAQTKVFEKLKKVMTGAPVFNPLRFYKGVCFRD